jgi:hypothetical protein
MAVWLGPRVNDALRNEICIFAVLGAEAIGLLILFEDLADDAPGDALGRVGM